MGYRKIVIGTDGSDSAAIAQASAARLAKRLLKERRAKKRKR